jgi:hypothetical protein
MKNLVVTLDINYPKEITDLTFSYMQEYAKNIDADFKVITKRKYPDLPIPMEKFQLYELCEDYDWTIFLDADCLINPNTVDFSKVVNNDVFIIGEYIDLNISQFVKTNIMSKYNIFIHIPGYFFAFYKNYKNVFKMPKNPLKFVRYIKNSYDLQYNSIDPSWHLDEFLISLNASKCLKYTLSLKDDFPNANIIAHNAKLSITRPSDKMLSVHDKIIFLNQNIERLKTMSNIQGEYV